MSNVKWIMNNIKKIKWAFLLSILLLIVETVCSVTMTGVQKWIIDDVFRQQNFDLLVPVVAVFVAAVLLYNLFHIFASMIRRNNQLLMQKKLLKSMVGTMFRMPVFHYQNERIGSMVHRATRDVNSVASTITSYVPSGLQTMFQLILLSVIIALANPLIFVLILCACSVFIVLGKYFAPRLKEAAREVRSSNSKLLVTIEEGISSTREVIAYHRQKWEKQKYDASFQDYFDRVMKEGKLVNKQMFWSDPVRWSVNLSVLGYGGFAVMQGTLSLGLFVVIYQFSTQLVNASYRAYRFVTGFSRQMAHVERLREFVEMELADSAGKALKSSIYRLKFDRVSFRYDSDRDDVLRNLTLDLPIGKKIAFVGKSGGGKSTIAQLLIRFYHPNRGSIFVNQTPLRTYSNSDWQQRIGVVFQEPYLFPDSIRNNLLLGRHGISEEEMIRICKLMYIHDLIASLPEGYDSQVGERGLKLSGGQRQRLALARVVLGNPEILILDEATSALDMETERQIQKNLDEIRRGRTTIVIAHRLSTVQNADVIYVLEQGRVAEMGTHDTLMQLDGIYKSLVHAQAGVELGA